MTTSVQKLARDLVRLTDQVHGLATTPRLSNSSIENGSLDAYDSGGQLVMALGRQWDGTYVAQSLSGPKPPPPSAPKLQAGPLSLTASWDGTWLSSFGVPDPLGHAPQDFTRVEVHVSELEEFRPEGALTLRGTIETPRGADVVVTPLAAKPQWVRLVARTLSGRASDPSPAAAIVPLAAIDKAELDAELEKLDRLVTETGVLLGANGKELASATGRLETAETRITSAFSRLGSAETQLAVVPGQISDANRVTLASASTDAKTKADAALTAAKADAQAKADAAKQAAITAAAADAKAQAEAAEARAATSAAADAKAKADAAQAAALAAAKAYSDAQASGTGGAALEAAKADATAKADAARQAAIAAAAADATAKKEAAEANAAADAKAKADKALVDAKADATTKANAAQSNATTAAALDATKKADAAKAAAVTAATVAAAADAKVQAEAAESRAAATAALDAKTKADAAQAAALAAAKTYADTQASGAGGTALAAAKADATAKADAAKAAAITAAALDATAKRELAESNAAADAKTKADAALAAAKTDAQTKATAAEAAAKTAAALDATTKANKALSDAKADATAKADAAQAAAVTAATTAAAANAKAQAEAAEARAAITAAADAKLKADAAQAAATAAGKAYADAQASGAGTAALDAAKADATAKADAAKAAAISAAAADATAKKEAAEATAAADAKAKADKALSDAKTDATTKANAAQKAATDAAAADATTKANAAKAAALVVAEQAVADARTAAGLASGKGRTFFQGEAPAEGIVHAWTGGANNSPSVERRDGTEVRRNQVGDPRATTINRSWLTGRWFGGGGGAGTHAIVTGAGPDGLPATMMRKAWTASPGGNGDTGLVAGPWSSFRPTAGATYTLSGYLRPTTSGAKAAYARIIWGSATGATVGTANQAIVTLKNNEWNRLSLTAVAPADVGRAHCILDIGGGGVAWAAGDFLDGTMVMFEEGGLQPYFDGDTPDDRSTDLWIDTSARNTPKRWDSAKKSWSPVTDQAAIDAATTAAALDATTKADKALADAKADATVKADAAKAAAVTAATTAAAADAKAQAEAAESRAATTAAADAKAKADAAQAAALAAAKTYADTQASGAGSSALTAAKADATAKADAAKAAAITAAALDATAKKEAAEANAALDAKAKADAALTAAKADATTKANAAETAAKAAAATDATTKAGNAQSAAIAAAAADAKTKADAAQKAATDAATAAASLDATAKADAAKAAATTAAAADAKAKADAAQAAAISSSSADAKAKAEAAQAAAVAAAALDAKAKADAAQSAATAASAADAKLKADAALGAARADAQTKADAAKADAIAAAKTETTNQVSVVNNAILGQVYYGTAAPTSTNPGSARIGSTYRHRDANGVIIAEYEWAGAAGWVQRKLSGASLTALDVGTLTAGDAVVSTAVAQKLAAAQAEFTKADIGNLTVTGTTNLQDAVAQRLAANVGSFVSLAVSQLVVGSGTMSKAVIDKLHADVVLSREVVADRVKAGAVDGQVITGATVRTGSSGARIEMVGTASGTSLARLTATRGDGSQYFSVDAVNGAQIEGSITTKGEVYVEPSRRPAEIKMGTYSSPTAIIPALTFRRTDIPASAQPAMVTSYNGDQAILIGKKMPGFNPGEFQADGVGTVKIIGQDGIHLYSNTSVMAPDNQRFGFRDTTNTTTTTGEAVTHEAGLAIFGAIQNGVPDSKLWGPGSNLYVNVSGAINWGFCEWAGPDQVRIKVDGIYGVTFQMVLSGGTATGRTWAGFQHTGSWLQEFQASIPPNVGENSVTCSGTLRVKAGGIISFKYEKKGAPNVITQGHIHQHARIYP